MSTTSNQIDLSLIKEIEVTPSSAVNTTDSLVSDTQVKIKKSYTPRRSLNMAHKLRILAAYDACKSVTERGALLRKESLYHSHIHAWKKQIERAKSDVRNQSRGRGRVDHLAMENEQLKKKLAHAEAIIDLQKKISELLGAHIHPHASSESK
jgi:transposase